MIQRINCKQRWKFLYVHISFDYFLSSFSLHCVCQWNEETRHTSCAASHFTSCHTFCASLNQRTSLCSMYFVLLMYACCVRTAPIVLKRKVACIAMEWLVTHPAHASFAAGLGAYAVKSHFRDTILSNRAVPNWIIVNINIHLMSVTHHKSAISHF